MTVEPPSKNVIIAITTVFFTLQLLAVIARFAVRRKEKVKPWIDDYLVLVASILFFAIYFVTVLVGVTRGLVGQHIVITPEGPVMPNYTTFTTLYVVVVFQPWVIGSARLSIVYLYRRIFVGQAIRIASRILIILTVLWMVSFFIVGGIVGATTCYPNGRRITSLDDPGPVCVNAQAWDYALGITGVLFDLVVLALPWPWIRKLQMRKNQKLGVAFIFLLGNLTLCASIVRCYFIFWVYSEFATGNPDFPYLAGMSVIWCEIEAATAIICSCLPSFGRIILKGPPAWGLSISSYAKSLFQSSSLPTSSSELELNQSGKASGKDSHINDRFINSDEAINEGFMTVTGEVEYRYERV